MIKQFMRFFLIVTVMFISCRSIAQIHLDSIKKEDFISDFNLAVDIIKKNHPNPFAFINEQDYDKKADSLKALLIAKPDVFTFIKVLQQTGTTVELDYQVGQQLFERLAFFPYPVILKTGRIFVNILNTEIPLGSEIVEINGISVLEILTDLAKQSSIGNISNFAKSFSLMNSGVKKYSISYIDRKSLNKKTVKVDAINYSTYFYRFNHKVYPFNIAETSQSAIYTDFDTEKNIGKITINSSDLSKESLYDNFSEFFKEVNKRKCEEIVIDIRNNKAGPPEMFALLFSHISKQSFSGSYIYKKNDIKNGFHEYRVNDNSDKFSEDELKHEEDYFFDIFIEDTSGRYVGNSLMMHGVNSTYLKEKDAFLGKVKVLVGADTDAVAVYFASLVQLNRRGTVIGDQTSGSVDVAETSAPGWRSFYKLPKTEFIMNIPQAEIYFFDATVDRGKGLIPDVTVPIDKFLDYVKKGKDPEMSFAIEN